MGQRLGYVRRCYGISGAAGLCEEEFPERRRSRGEPGKVTLRPGGSASNLQQRHARCYRSFISGSGIVRAKGERPSLQVDRALPLTAHAVPIPPSKRRSWRQKT